MQPVTAASQQATTMPTGPDGTPFEQLLESSRRDLTGYCYRMLGASSEAEDAVQETMIKAWSARDSFAGQSSLRTWLFRIAHNVCVNMVRSPQRRARPMDLGASTRTADAVLGAPLPENAFVQPIPDQRVIDTSGDPAAVAEARDSIRLAFVAALQHLPPLQRSALILCEVLKWSAAEVATLLEVTPASINSALQRARKTMSSHRAAASMPLEDPAHRHLLNQYLRAFEAYDMNLLVSLLRDDVVLSMPPFGLWLSGPDDVIAWFVGKGSVCENGRLIPLDVNGAGGFANYHFVEPGLWKPWAIQVIETDGGRIIGHHNFLYPELFESFGLPTVIDERERPAVGRSPGSASD
ncbi:sigma-70 family RNA polymerase sigma factor [Arthrobacter agilis]|uniref:sigma-70 family RNA polymerase sigma factor n=1 Tax=Arthrobacter agilis TaxID=37921 RepID=UPI0023670CFA|nr:sigma-70 family RNA polymerase sigma factor [Arthrobacter agilis]WDF33292.1 sigma-70 family RNA polymerase sigma factor [Arthrobacter agilis]